MLLWLQLLHCRRTATSTISKGGPSMHLFKRLPFLIVPVLIASMSASLTAADFTPPKDGKLTEKQVTTYIDIAKEQMDAYRAAGKAAEGNKSGAANLAILMRA